MNSRRLWAWVCLNAYTGGCVCLSVCVRVSAAVQCEVCTQRPAACDCQSYDSFGNLWSSSTAITPSLPHSASLPSSTTPTSSLSISCSFLSPLIHPFLSFWFDSSAALHLSCHLILFQHPSNPVRFFIHAFLSIFLFLIVSDPLCFACSCCWSLENNFLSVDWKKKTTAEKQSCDKSHTGRSPNGAEYTKNIDIDPGNTYIQSTDSFYCTIVLYIHCIKTHTAQLFLCDSIYATSPIQM